MQLFFTMVCIRIITLTWIFHDHPLVEYPLTSKYFLVLFHSIEFMFPKNGLRILLIISVVNQFSP